MNVLLVVLVILLLFGAPAGWHYGGPALGGSLGLVLLVLLILVLAGRL
jgi:hypothetical protein